MSKRDWLPHVAFAGWLATCLLGAFAWSQGVTIACLSSGVCPAKPQGSPKQKEAASTPAPIAGQQEKTSAEKADCADPKHREEADCVQRRMAQAAEQTVALADAQFWWNVTQAVGTILAAFAAAYAAWAAGEAAKASQRSANAAEHALRGLERPYLFIEKIMTAPLHPRRAGRPSIVFTVVNYGKTPAILRAITMRLQSDPALPLRLPMANRKTYYSVVPPGKHLIHRGGDEHGTMEVEGSREGQSFIGVRMASLVLQGVFYYEDPTGASYVDRFCLRGNRDGDSFTIEGGATYNWRKTRYPKGKPDETDA